MTHKSNDDDVPNDDIDDNIINSSESVAKINVLQM